VVPAPAALIDKAARTEKLSAAPSEGDVAAASGRADTLNDGPANEKTITNMIDIERTFSLCILFGLLRQTRPTKGYKI
jgi:hypothetical protein